MPKNLLCFVLSLVAIATDSLGQQTKIPVKKITESYANNTAHDIFMVQKANPKIKEGLFTHLYYDTKLTEGNYSNNEKTGLWKYNDFDGNLSFSGLYSGNLKTGLWTYYNNNKLSAEIFYTNGKIDSATGYYENKVVSYSLRYERDSIGICKTFYEGGNLKELIPLKGTEKHGVYTLYFENGQVHYQIQYKEGKTMTILATFDAKGKPIYGGSLVDGNGILITYYEPEKEDTGELLTNATENYKNGLLHGNCKYVNKKGLPISVGKYEDGRRVGDWKTFDENGIFKTTVNYNNEFIEILSDNNPSTCFSNMWNDSNRIMPKFQGSENHMAYFLSENIKYPGEATLDAIVGTVYIDFVVNENGEIESYKITKNIHPSLDKEVIRLIETMPRWNPGIIYGLPVRFQCTLPVKFQLGEE